MVGTTAGRVAGLVKPLGIVSAESCSHVVTARDLGIILLWDCVRHSALSNNLSSGIC